MDLWRQAMQKTVIVPHTFERVHIMRPNFTTQCIIASQDGSEELMSSVFRPNEICDGLCTDESFVVLGLTNGDCPAAIVYDQDAHKLALLHCGLKSLVQKDGGIGIFQAFFESHDFDRRTVKVRLVYGIGPCCYGLDWLPECHKNALVKEFPTAVATEGPEKTKQSIDLFALMRSQLLELGLQNSQILRETKPLCTACAKINGESAFHSNLYDRSSKKRNLVLAWMQPRA
ncbi:MAG: laccase domain-containing protein [bacterium]|nr:laccase domain-containing protein [bacterium]